MKLRCLLLLVLPALFSLSVHAQSNSFPSSGPVLIGSDGYLSASRLIFQGATSENSNWTRGVVSSTIRWVPSSNTWSVPLSPSTSDFAMLRFEDNGVISFYNRVNQGSGYQLTNNELNAFKRLTILNNGNVGIGTAAPQAKLAVNGQIRATEVKVQANINVPDYVFEPDYPLLPLSEIAEFVRKHKHLPEVPDAAAIHENGIDLGGMSLLLLKKVEELTLHLISEQRAREKLEGEVALLKEQLADRRGHYD